MPIKKAADYCQLQIIVSHFFTVLIIFLLANIALPSYAQTPIVINSYRDSNVEKEEWTELIVTQDNVDLRGYTIRDNSSSGAWQPFVRFKNIDYWNHMRRGTIIVLFHRDPVLPDFINQLNTSKKDGHIALSIENENYFEYEGGGSLNMTSMSLAIAGDMVQLRNASNMHIHALGHRQDTTTNFSYWDLLPRPKLNHRANLISANKQAVMVTPGANIDQFGTLNPINGLTYTTVGTKINPGFPNGGDGNVNAGFWRSLRQPEWINPSMTATYNPVSKQVSLNWNALVDDYPSDNIQGYIVLRSPTENGFQTPQDGITHGVGNLLGGATVVALINGSNTTSFTDVYGIPGAPAGIPCDGHYYYRIYPFRYATDEINEGSGPARGRSYNENAFAAAKASNPVPSTSISIQASSQNVSPGTQVTFTATLTNPGTNPSITWLVNGVQQQTGTSATFTWTFTTSATVTATLQSSLPCATTSSSNPIVITVTSNPCIPGNIFGPEILCINSNHQYTSNSPVSGIWSSSNTTIATVNETTGLVTAHQPGTFSLFFTVDNSTCTGNNVASKIVNINPLPDAGNSQQICNAKAASISANSPTAGQGFWSIVDTPPNITGYPSFQNGDHNPDNTVIVHDFGKYIFSWNILGCGSDTITITFKPLETLSLDLSPSSPEVCPGQNVSFAATASHASLNNSFEWYRNGSIVNGANSPTFTINSPANGEQVGVRYQTDAFCLSSNQVYAGPVQISVLPEIVEPIEATASRMEICDDFNEEITLTAFGGSGAVLNWYSDICGGTLIGTGTDIDIAPPNQTTTYYARWETPGCGFSNCKSVTITVLPTVQPSLSISANKINICENETVHFTASPVNGGISPHYQWFKNGVMVGDNAPVYSGEGWQAGDQVYCVLVSSDQCANPVQVQSNTITLVVSPLVIPALRIGASATEACIGSTVSFSVTEISGQGNNPQYQWFVNGFPASGANGTTFSLQLTANVSVHCRLVSSETCSSVPFEDSNTITVNVQQQVSPQITITASQSQVCEGTSVSFFSNISGGGDNPTYAWRVNDVVSSTQASFVLVNPSHGDVVDCILTSNAACATQPSVASDPITLQVEPNLPVTATIQSPQFTGTICQGTSLSFISITENGGPTPEYQWLINGFESGTGSTFSYDFSQPGTYQLVLQFTSSLACTNQNPVNSNTLEINVLPQLSASVQLVASITAACENTSIQLTAEPQHPGQSPTYDWFRNGSLFQTTPSNQLLINALPGDEWQVSLNSSEQCVINSPALSGTVVLQIDALPVAPAEIIASTTQLCSNSGGIITLTAQGGSGQQVQWFADECGQNFIGTGNPLIINAPQQNTTFFAQYLSGLCPPSACGNVSVTVNEMVVPTIQITSNTSQVCQGSEVVYTIQSLNGQGAAPVFDWLVNGIAQGINATAFTYHPFEGDLVQCQLISSEACAQPSTVLSSPVALSVNPVVQPMVSIQAMSDTVCYAQPIVINSNFINGGNNPTYQWMINNNHLGHANSTFFWYAPEPGNYQIYLLATSSLECVTSPNAFSLIVNITVLPSVQPHITISTLATTLCQGEATTVSTSFNNQGLEPQFQWYKNGLPIIGENSATLTLIPAHNDFLYCVMASSEQCADPAIVTSNGLLFNVLELVQPVALVLTPTNQVCQGSEATFVASFSGGGTQPLVEWYINNELQTSGQNFIYIPQHNDQVYYRLTSSLTCAQPGIIFSDTITMQVDPLLEPAVSIASSSTSICQGTQVEVIATAINGGTMPQYAWYINGLLQLTTSQVLTYTPQHEDSVRCVLTTSEQCASNPTASSSAITFDVTPTFEPMVSIEASQSHYCEGEMVIINAQVNQSGLADVYQWFINGTVSGSNAAVLHFPATGSQTVHCLLTSSVACASPQQAYSGDILIQALPVLAPSISISASQQQVCQGTQVSFQASWQNGGNNPTFQWLVNGQIHGNQSIFSYQPSNDDQVQCKLFSDYACASPTPIESEIVVMQVSENLGLLIEKTNATCNGGPGSVVALGIAGKEPYSYRIEGLTDWQESGEFSGLQAGNYTVGISDLFGCQNSEQVEIITEAGPSIIEIQHIPASNGYSNASITITAQGTQPLHYSLDGTNWQISPVFNGLAAGPLSAFVRDGNGCLSVQQTSIDALPVTITAAQAEVCNGTELTVAITTDGFAAATRIILEIKFDNALLSYSTTNQINPLISDAAITTTSQPGLLRLLLEKSNGMHLPGGGTMMNLVFNTLSSGSSILKWEDGSTLQTQYQAAADANFLDGLAKVRPVPLIDLDWQIKQCVGKPLEINPMISGNVQNLLWTLPNGDMSDSPTQAFAAADWSKQGL
jgi:hypothetical protein